MALLILMEGDVIFQVTQVEDGGCYGVKSRRFLPEGPLLWKLIFYFHSMFYFYFHTNRSGQAL